MKTCNFGQYLNTKFCDQFVCCLNDCKCQRELLTVQELTLKTTIKKTITVGMAMRE